MAPDPAEDRGHAVHRHRRLGVGDVRAGSRAPAGGGGVPAVRGVARRTSGRITQVTGQLPVRQQRLPRRAVLPGQPLVPRSSRRWSCTAGRGPRVPLYPAISQQLQLAVGAAVAGRQDAGAGGGRRVARGAGEQRRGARGRPPPAGATGSRLVPMLGASRLALARARGRCAARRAAARGWLLPALVLSAALIALPDARPGAAVLHRHRRLRLALPLHARELPRACSPTPRVLPDGGGHARVRGRVGGAAARPGPRGGGAGGRRAAPRRAASRCWRGRRW